MSKSRPARTARQRARSTLTALLVVAATLIGAFGCLPLAGSSSRASPSATPPAHASRQLLRDGVPRDLPGRRQGGDRLGLGVADGAMPDGVTVFDDTYPGVSRLDPALLAALRSAATAARDEGVVLYVNSGWRSPAYQQHLLDQAVSEYGSRSEAARWVSTPGTSAHVSGNAVDIGPSNATAWLSDHGAEYGLCQIYGNEPWHYELRTDAAHQGCPAMYADPTRDPRMQR